MSAPKTKKHALYLIGAIEARINKRLAANAEDAAELEALAALAPTLPEGPPPPAAEPFAVGSTVRFRFGRTDKEGNAPKEFVGAIVARRDKPLAYRITTGEGFDAQTLTVPHGSVLGSVQASA